VDADHPEGQSSIPKLGVGNPVSVAAPQPGETLLDLGSGPGLDVLRASDLVGDRGKAIGVDATPEMVFRARETARARGRRNVEFRLGEIEHLPIESASVDVVISDCVINLSPDKAQVFRDAFRVLKPGGRIVVSDVVADHELPVAVREDPEAWAACVAGAVSEAAYLELLWEAGFEDIRSGDARGSFLPGLHSALVIARKPLSRA
jgi:ubiquinone/menaquinone biosynthesis C-methylase UbiE